MNRINLLDENTSNKIAAGEVVERPSSVIKELVENSIDANAKNITIEVQDGGCSSIRIIDDGYGIHKDDLKKAFMPHATSKIKDANDIFSINTLGFRGEALASIASVSKISLKTKQSSDDFGREILIEGGTIIYEGECACNNGTTIEVNDLFFNVPARKKFLKSFTREGAIINDIINRIAMSKPDISFKLFNNNKKILQTFGTNNLKDVLRVIYGKKITDNIIYFENKNDYIKIYGYIGREDIARGSRNNQSIFVNNRYIKNRTLSVAVENAFKSFSTVNKFPFFILFIDIYPEYVDVNIHPTKSEIKFKDDRVIFKMIFDSVHSVLKEDVFDNFKLPEEDHKKSTSENIKMDLDFNDSQIKFNSFEKNNKLVLNDKPIDYSIKIKDAINKEKKEFEKLKGKFIENKISINHSDNIDVNNEVKDLNSNIKLNNDYSVLYDEIKSNPNNTISNASKMNKLENAKDKIAKFPPLKIIGQFNKTYIIAEFNDIMYLIDQHAAHEKILFEKYLNAIKNGSLVVQPLLVPTIIDLTIDDLAYYIENKEVFKNAGFLVDDFGGNSIALKEVPYFLGKIDSKDLFLNIIDDLKKLGTGKTIDIKYNKIATMACKKAVKANDVLTEKEMISLIEDLRFIDDPFHCPHGRPTIIKFTNIELEKKFRRIV